MYVHVWCMYAMTTPFTHVKPCTRCCVKSTTSVKKKKHRKHSVFLHSIIAAVAHVILQ